MIGFGSQKASMAVVRALLLTDVVESTKLSASLGDAAMARLWTAHDRLARDLLRGWGGREIDKSDGMLVLFEKAVDALGYARAYHQAIAGLEVPVKARAGLHVGPVTLRESSRADVALGAKPVEVDGISKAIAARVMSVAQGGQTLLTADARSALGEAAPGTQSRGWWRMKGVPEPIELFEAGDGDAPPAAPPDSVNAYRVVRNADLWLPVRDIKHRIPAERDRFIGRRAHLLDLATRLGEGARLLSILGIGGSGKTRLAIRFARTSLGEFPGGVWFCDLSSARSLDGIARAVADALDVPLGKEDPIAQLGSAMAGRGDCLVMLDNFEQVSRYAQDTLGRWLDRAPNARFLVTTREVLGLSGEATLALPPLSTSDAAALFLDRARQANQELRASHDDEEVIAQLMSLLDGLPLAIELAAARIRVMSPKLLLARMNERFKVLASTGGRRDRQATLRATFDWSWDLLSASDKTTLAQLSVFESGFCLESAEAVLAGLSDGVLPAATVHSLIDKSFVRHLGNGRFDLLVSVQEYASEHLRTEGRFPGSGIRAALSTEERHWRYFAGIGEAGAIANRGVEIDNLVTACRRSSARGAARDAVAILQGAWAAIRLRGPYRVALELAFLVRAMELEDDRARAHVELIAGNAFAQSGKTKDARAHLQAALAFARRARDQKCEAGALSSLGWLDVNEGQMHDAQANLEAALALGRTVDRVIEWEARNGLGSLCEAQGRIDEARHHFQAALEVSRALGDRRREGRTLGNLGILHIEQGQVPEARALYQSALLVAGETGDRQWEGNTLCNLGLLHQLEGRSAEATTELERALVLAREIGHVRLESITLCNLGIVYDSLGQGDVARARLEAALAIAHDIKDQRSEGQVLTYLALVDAHAGRFDAARRRLDVGQALLKAASDKFSLGILKCSRAETEQLAGEPGAAKALLEDAQEIAADISAGPHSELGQAIARVRRLCPEDV